MYRKMNQKTLLVSLVSDQTIPNVQLIKEFKKISTDYLFVTTAGMEKKGARCWVENACNIKGEIIKVNEYSFADINEKLQSCNLGRFDKVVVNLTGGTKIMTMVAEEFFKSIGADIFYVTGKNNEYIRIFPKGTENVLAFEQKLTVADYLTAYGFTFQEPKPAMFSIDVAKPIVELYSSDERIQANIDAIRFINIQRSKEKGVKTEDLCKVESFLKEIQFPLQNDQLTAEEVKYLSGEWLEEYVGLKIKGELNLSDDEIFIGTNISKEVGNSREKNNVRLLLGDDADLKNADSKNEMDVMFMFEGKFYSIECKSSIIAYKTIVDKNGNPVEKPYNILGETIYKSDSLKGKFGLFPQTTILTLTDLQKYWSDIQDKGLRNNRMREMENLINRANLSNIKLVDRKMINGSESIFELVK